MPKSLLVIFLTLSFFLAGFQPALAETTVKVLKVIDGDTIQVNINGKKEVVRLLGIDAPESVDPQKPIQCFSKAATDKMKSLVLGKSVILTEDNSQGNRDKNNRLLRYVYLPNSSRTFVNGEMVKQGYAFSYREYPTKYRNKFNTWETYAKDNNLGLWGSCPLNVSPTKKPVSRIKTAPVYTAPTKAYIAPTKAYVAPVIDSSASTNVAPATNESGGFSCAGKTKCGEMTSCAEAQFYLNSCGLSRLDGDGDGTPCESICN